jgi:hypothetical protein
VVAAPNKLLNKPDNDISVSSVGIYIIVVLDGVKRAYIPGSNLISISPYFSFKINFSNKVCASLACSTSCKLNRYLPFKSIISSVSLKEAYPDCSLLI